LALRPGLDNPLSLHGGGGVVDLAPVRNHRCQASANPFHNPISAERGVVRHLFSPAFSRGGFPGGTVLWIFILATTIAFGAVSRTAAYIMVPYLLWVTFASTLNGAIWRLNS
jgi:hypothetical protein